MTGLRIVRIDPVHPRRPDPSYIELRLMPEDRKSNKLTVYTLSETQALELAEMALASARIMRQTRDSAAAFAEIDRLDRLRQEVREV